MTDFVRHRLSVLVSLLAGATALIAFLGGSILGGPINVTQAQSAAITQDQRALVTQPQSGEVTLQWLGWNAWRLTSPEGKVIWLNPFINNPDAPIRLDSITKADLILVTDGHGDEVGQSVDIAKNTGGRVIPAGFGLGGWFIDVGVPTAQVTRLSPGERYRADGITVRVLHGVHGSDINAQPGPTTTTPSGGIAGTFMVTLENGWTLFYGGSSAATQDMALWAGMYQPDAAIVQLSSNKEPMDFALEVKLLMTDNPNLRTIFPGHHRYVQPLGATTIDEAQQAVNAMGIGLTVTEPAPGQEFTFTR
jgi:L-ascorbate metabolism protein UlaG (beta-lactamase superfamily)